jgi:hypothetical protein
MKTKRIFLPRTRFCLVHFYKGARKRHPRVHACMHDRNFLFVCLSALQETKVDLAQAGDAGLRIKLVTLKLLGNGHAKGRGAGRRDKKLGRAARATLHDGGRKVLPRHWRHQVPGKKEKKKKKRAREGSSVEWLDTRGFVTSLAAIAASPR